MIYIMRERYAVQSVSGSYFGGITSNYEYAKKILEKAKTLYPEKEWRIVSWYD